MRLDIAEVDELGDRAVHAAAVRADLFGDRLLAARADARTTVRMRAEDAEHPQVTPGQAVIKEDLARDLTPLAHVAPAKNAMAAGWNSNVSSCRLMRSR